jgi:D-mannonate dehydratase
LNARNKITGIGALTIPVLRYNFHIINWRAEEIKKINRKSSKILTIYKMHHSKADIDRLYGKIRGGRGLLQIEVTYKAQIINIAEYLNTKYRQPIYKYCLKATKSINQISIQQLK